jgi:DNA-binding response OmpR family regulator
MSGYDFSNLRIMICDDSRQIRSLVNTFLHGFGIKDVLEVKDADQAFKEMSSFDPDLIITDWNMAHTSGLEFVKRVRTSDESSDPFLPIIMLTGYTEMDRVVKARDSGISAFLAKPVSANSLYKRLVAVVDDERSYVRANDFFGPDRRSGRRQSFGGEDRREPN